MERTTNILMMNAVPLHKGHEYCIRFFDQASDNSEGFIIYPSLDPSSEYEKAKLKATREILSRDTNVKVIRLDLKHFSRAEPLSVDDNEYWSQIEQFINYHCIPMFPLNFYSSETYGKLLAKKVGKNSTHATIDPNRVFANVSGTEIRNDLFSNFSKLSDYIKPFFRENVILFGAESVGKTTLARKFDKHQYVDTVDEWARPYLESLEDNSITYSTMEKIAHHQIFTEKTAQKMSTKPIILFDTDIVSTYGYYILKGLTPPTFVKLAAERVAQNPQNNYYCLKSNNIPFKADALRYGGNVRESHDGFWYDLLETLGCKSHHMVDASHRDIKRTVISGSIISIEYKLKNFIRPT